MPNMVGRAVPPYHPLSTRQFALPDSGVERYGRFMRHSHYFVSRRQFLASALCTMTGVAVTAQRPLKIAESVGEALPEETFAFIRGCARDDGGYAPSPD